MRPPAIHNGLAEWYLKLFHASDDSAAAFEAIHHRCEQAIWLIENYDRCKNQTIIGPEIRNALASVLQTLTLAKPHLLRSGFSKGSCRYLEQMRLHSLERIESILDQQISSVPPVLADRIRSQTNQIKAESIRLNRTIGREVAENRKAIDRHRELLELELKIEKSGRSNEAPSKSHDIYVLHQLKRRAFEKTRLFLETTVEMGTLGISVRGYEFSVKMFRDWAYDFVQFPESIIDRSHWDDDCRERLMTWSSILPDIINSGRAKLNLSPLSDDRLISLCHLVRSRICTTLQREQQLHLTMGHGEHLAGRRFVDQRKVAREKSYRHYQYAVNCYHAAIALLRFIHWHDTMPFGMSHDSGFPGDNLPQLFDDRQRLETQYGLSLSFLRDFLKAHRRLNEAESCLGRAGHGAGSLESAIIDLHRAEVFTQQSVFEPMLPTNDKDGVPPDRMTSLGASRREMLDRFIEQIGVPQVSLQEVVREYAFPSQQELIASLSYVDDAWQTLDRAEKLLDHTRKNVWWVTWFFELRLKLVELRIFSSLRDQLSPDLPILGLDYAPRNTSSLADLMLENSIRMIRLDVYRMARIIESYTNCLLALVVWRFRARLQSDATNASTEDLRELHSTQSDLRARQSAMRKTLREATQQLQGRFDERAEIDKSHKVTQLHPTVHEYVTFTLRYAESVDGWIAEWENS